MTRKDVPLTSPVAPAPLSEVERHDELSLRPTNFLEFIGQAELVEHLRIVLGAARARHQPSDHLLFAGPPGLGKTSLAAIVANELGATLKITSGPVLSRPGDLAALLSSLSESSVLFIDEIHRLNRAVEEVLYPAMEDRRLDVMIGRGPSARSLRLELPPFTLVGATTRTGLVAAPLRDRFGFVGRLELYSDAELESIVTRSAGLLGVALSAGAAHAIASRSRGTPRVANRLLRRVRDVAEVEGRATVDEGAARRALDLFGVDERGLDKVDRQILTILCEKFRGQPVGLVTLAHACGEEPDTVEEAHEPYLVREGYISRTPRGRVATERAYRHLGVPPPHGPVLEGFTTTK